MSNENNAIHGFDVNLICDFFLNTERQGPGNPEVTLKALSFIDNLTDESLIADLGCGTGGQTMTLARHAPGRITGLDFFPGFIDRFNADARRLHLADRVKGVVGSMDAAFPRRGAGSDLVRGGDLQHRLRAGPERVARIPEAGRLSRGLRKRVVYRRTSDGNP